MHPWHLRGRTVQLITCGTVQLFFDFLLRPLRRSSFSLISCSARLIFFFLFCSFCQLLLDFSAASCKFGFSAKHDFEPFRDFSSFPCSKLNLPIYHFALICRLCICLLLAERFSFSFSLIPPFVLYLMLFHQLRSGLGSSAPRRPAPHRSAIARGYGAPCSALRCPVAYISCGTKFHELTSGLGSSAPHRPAPHRIAIARSNAAPCSPLRCPAALA